MIGLTPAPASVRGALKRYYSTNPGAAYVELVNFSGHGKLLMILIATDATGFGSVKATLDGEGIQPVTNAAALKKYCLSIDPLAGDALQFKLNETSEFINMEFKASCLVEVKNTADSIHFHAIIQED